MSLHVGPNVARVPPERARMHHVTDDELGLIGGYWLAPDGHHRLKRLGQGLHPTLRGSARIGFAVGPVPRLLPDAVDIRGTGRGTEVAAECVAHAFCEFAHLWVNFPRESEYDAALHIVRQLGFEPFEHPGLNGHDISDRMNMLGKWASLIPPHGRTL